MWTDNETALDLLGFNVHADLVRSVVIDPKLLPVTIGVFADWGGGKTSLMKMLEKSLDPASWPNRSKERSQCEKVACLYFNGWLFEGYDDAKSAILSSVLLALGEHTRLGPKVRKKCATLLKSVNWMRVASLGMKHVAMPAITAYVTGGTSIVPALADKLSPWLPTSLVTKDPEKATDKDIPDEEANDDNWESLIKADKTPASPLDVRTFREQFGKMLQDCDIDSLVVLIDDLDRCSPERIVENLEAIKLFLNVDRTAFVIGADPRIVRHAISHKYQKQDHLGDEFNATTQSTLVTDYLEKLIQYPYRLPRLSPAEIETYMSLLFCQSHLAEDLFQMTVEACNQHRNKNRYAVFGYALVVDALKANGTTDYPDGFLPALAFCAEASSLITEGLKGNPRQVKRFLNAYVLRKKLAAVAQLTNIRDDVLVKLMILEYAHEKRFRELYDWQAAQHGFPSEIKFLEAAGQEEQAVEGSDGKVLKAITLPEDWHKPSIKKWIDMKPPLSEIDLRDYFWVARDRLQSSMSGLSMIPPVVRRAFEGLVDDNPPKRQAAINSASEFAESDREQLFDLLEQHLVQKSTEKRAYDAFRFLADKEVANSGKRLSEAFLSVPEANVPPAVGNDLLNLLKSKPKLKPYLEPVSQKWSKASQTKVGKAIAKHTQTACKK